MRDYIDVGAIDSRKFSKHYLFDTNVWIYLNGPFVEPNDYKTRVYSKLLKRIAQSGGSIYTTGIVVSEFANRYLRMTYEFFCRKNPGTAFKDFRKTDEFSLAAEGMVDEVNTIMGIGRMIDLLLTKELLSEVCAGIARGRTDFTDEVIVLACKRNDLTLVTHDRDFLSFNVPVLSCNGAYR